MILFKSIIKSKANCLHIFIFLFHIIINYIRILPFLNQNKNVYFILFKVSILLTEM